MIVQEYVVCVHRLTVEISFSTESLTNGMFHAMHSPISMYLYRMYKHFLVNQRNDELHSADLN